MCFAGQTSLELTDNCLHLHLDYWDNGHEPPLPGENTFKDNSRLLVNPTSVFPLFGGGDGVESGGEVLDLGEMTENDLLEC